MAFRRHAVLALLFHLAQLLPAVTLQFGAGDAPPSQLLTSLRDVEVALKSHNLSAAHVRAKLRRMVQAAFRGSNRDDPEPDEGALPEVDTVEGVGPNWAQTFSSGLENMCDQDFEIFSRYILRRETSMLSDSQRQTLNAVEARNITKQQIEIVMAHYNETVEWATASVYKDLLTPYCKGDKHALYPKRPLDCTQLPNVGRESHTFLHHIIENYDRLADWTVFTQAQAPTVGWSGMEGDERHGHIYPGATFHDYVLGGGPFAGDGGDDQGSRFIFNGQWKVPLPGAFEWEKGVRMAFAGNFWTYRHENEWSRLDKTCLRLEATEGQLNLGGAGAQSAVALVNFVDMLGLDHSKKFYSQGARFALSRERIRQRPREFYLKLIDTVDKDNNPIASVFLEFLWYYVAGGAALHERPCQDHPLTQCPDGFEQLGDVADHIPEGLLQSGNPGSIENCAAQCRSDLRCGAFEYHTHRPKQCNTYEKSVSETEKQVAFWPGALTCRQAK